MAWKSTFSVVSAFVIRVLIYLQISTIAVLWFNLGAGYGRVFLISWAAVVLLVSAGFVWRPLDFRVLSIILCSRTYFYIAVAVLSIGWIALLVRWLLSVDGFQDVEQSTFYFQPLAFLMSLPAGLAPVPFEILWYVLLGAPALPTEPPSQHALIWGIVQFWATYFALFAIQLFVLRELFARAGKRTDKAGPLCKHGGK